MTWAFLCLVKGTTKQDIHFSQNIQGCIASYGTIKGKSRDFSKEGRWENVSIKGDSVEGGIQY